MLVSYVNHAKITETLRASFCDKNAGKAEYLVHYSRVVVILGDRNALDVLLPGSKWRVSRTCKSLSGTGCNQEG